MRGTPSLLRSAAAFLILMAGAAPLPAQETEVRAVLFFSPSCPHCHDVMDRELPPLLERFGDRLQVVTINAATPDGGRLYQDVVQRYGLPRERLGVPALVVGDRVLVGSREIPDLLPGIVTAGLAAGGIDWPDVSSIRGALAAAGLLRPLPATPPVAAEAPRPAAPDPARAAAPETPPAAAGRAPVAPPQPQAGAAAAAAGQSGEPAPAADTAAATASDSDSAAALQVGGALPDLTENAPPPTRLELFMRDPAGNGVAVVVLLGLLAVLGWSAASLRGTSPGGAVPAWTIPALVVVGMVVAAYLSFIEVTGSTAVCGPVGDCNTVQQSPYATLFGVLPVGVLGLIGYVGIGAAWAGTRAGSSVRRYRAVLLLWAVAFAGTVFSAYLTFLEPFVIGASCAWCLTSAAVIAVILMAATLELQRARALR
jgi:uncharacterized membrane protein/thiol-disulfide isomerase/thioredoxin